MRSRRRGALCLAVAVAMAVPAFVTVSPLPAARATTGVTATRVAGDLRWPSMFTFAPDGSLFYSELFAGRIGVRHPDGSDATWFQVPDGCTDGGQGLYGVALHPDFPTVASIYAYVTRRGADSVSVGAAGR